MSATEVERHNAMMERANQMLAEVATVQDAAQLRDYAEVARVYALQMKLGAAAVNHATAVKMRAEVKIAEAWEKIPNRRPSGVKEGVRSSDTFVSADDIGVDKRRLSEAKLIRDAYGDDGILDALAKANEHGTELARHQLIKAGRRIVAADKPEAPQPETSTTEPTAADGYTTIVIDPPWRYDNTITRGAAEDHYPTMTLTELAELHIPAAANAHMYLWVTNSFIRAGFDLLEAWGFMYKTTLTWCKPQIGMGNYFRNNTEHVLFAVRGTLRTQQNNIGTWFKADRRRHSAKPESFYDLVESTSPGPWLEMFARRRRFGWHTWGNEA